MVVRVDLFVDPACMWSWLTSRWLVEVAPKRGLQVQWRTYSLLLRDGRQGLEEWKAALWGASLRAVRVMQALHADDLDGVGRFYGALITGGVAAYNAGWPPFAELERTLLAATDRGGRGAAVGRRCGLGWRAGRAGGVTAPATPTHGPGIAVVSGRAQTTSAW